MNPHSKPHRPFLCYEYFIVVVTDYTSDCGLLLTLQAHPLHITAWRVCLFLTSEHSEEAV